MQDKKGRLYIVTAAADTKVDLKRAPVFLCLDLHCRGHLVLFVCVTLAAMDKQANCKQANMSLPLEHLCAVLSLRLGCGKGGLRMAPDDLLTDVLQVR